MSVQRTILARLDLKGGTTQTTHSRPCILKCSTLSAVTLLSLSLH